MEKVKRCSAPLGTSNGLPSLVAGSGACVFFLSVPHAGLSCKRNGSTNVILDLVERVQKEGRRAWESILSLGSLVLQ